MTLYDLPAPAKLNLFLHVVGRRDDGYHLLESLFRLISLSDSITMDLRRDGQISRESDLDNAVSEQDDLTVKAARLLQQRTGTRLGAHLAVKKRIPVGGGLGGGSSDAATVLIGLNRLWRTGLNTQALAGLGLVLGADVPFFVFGQTAFVQGVGEQITPVCAPDMSYLVLKPGVGVPTARIFGDRDLTRNSDQVKISDFSGTVRFVESNEISSGFGRNDLELVACRLFPAVSEGIEWVKREGYSVRLSGSGSCFFAEFDRPEDAELARDALTAKMMQFGNGSDAVIEEVFACDGLPQHPLRHWLKD